MDQAYQVLPDGSSTVSRQSWWNFVFYNGYSKLFEERDEEARWCPEENASIFSKAAFSWATGLMWLGNQKVLVASDLWSTAKVDESGTVASKFDAAWEKEKEKPKASIGRALFRAYGGSFMVAGALKLVYDALQFANPVILRQLVNYLEREYRPVNEGISWALLLLFCNLVQSVCIHNYFHRVYRVSMHVRIASISVIYRKSLMISSAARQSTSLGEIANLQSNDAQKLAQMCIYLHILWSGPLQIFGALGLLFFIINVIPALSGLAVIFLLFPFNTIIMRQLSKIRKRLLTATDSRVKLLSEVLGNMKAIKLYAWEQPFRRRIEGLRTAEMRQITISVILETLTMFFYILTPTLVSVASLTVYTLMGNTLSAAVAFPALSLFNIVRFPLIMIPDQIIDFIQAQVSAGRVEKFLALPEMTRVDSDPASAPGSIKISEASFAWTREEGAEDEPKDTTRENERNVTLKGINLEVTPGELLIVVGQVGAGKSSLLAAMLGECERTRGDISVTGSVAYTSQDPWIQNASLQDNVLMGRPFDEEKYNRAVHVSALVPDFASLPAGDQTEIGEKGINLSGGQKHRVALARAVYADADIYLLDDPLSAVDTHVGRHLFDQCIASALEGKTRVLVTHQLQYMEKADRIAVIVDGSLLGLGTLAELRASQAIDNSLFEQNFGMDEDSQDSSPAAVPDDLLDGPAELLSEQLAGSFETGGSVSAHEAAMMPVDGTSNPELGAPQASDSSTTAVQNGEKESEKASKASAAPIGTGGSLVLEETRSVGKVQLSVYGQYLRAWGYRGLMPGLVILAFAVAQLAKLGNDTWLAVWSEGVKSGKAPVSFYLKIYAMTALATAVLAAVRGIVLALSTLKAARSLHSQLLARVLRLPMAFFDSQPTGRLLNRFTRDTEQVDLNLPDTMMSFLTCLFQVVFAVGLIVVITPLFVIPMLPLAALYYGVQRFYVATSRELKRLDSLMRSPVFAHFSESVQGLLTIRAFRQQERFLATNAERLDGSTRAYFASVVANRWLGLRLEVVGASAVFATGFFCVWGPGRALDAAFAGLALTSAFSITTYMSWMVRMNAEIETEMNSVERVLEYSRLPTEAPDVIESRRPPPQWPTQGAIEARGIVVRYRANLEPVLRGINFIINGGEKVGIAGRTGCGKSTLMMALYRIMELQEGALVIDGIDISTIGLQDLRSRLALVPQDPVIFSGSVRSNLDPFEEAGSDDELMEALRQAGMASTVAALPGGLNADLAEGGSNLSTGQRQLICMARALLRHTQILILDEATSNVDGATDALIQATIREAFGRCTVLTIAHRLHTIIDSDRVLLLDKGQVAEFDSPAALLADDASTFSGFISQTLPHEAAALRKMAAGQPSELKA